MRKVNPLTIAVLSFLLVIGGMAIQAYGETTSGAYPGQSIPEVADRGTAWGTNLRGWMLSDDAFSASMPAFAETCAENEIFKFDSEGNPQCAADAAGGGGASLFDEFIADTGTNPIAGDTNDELSILGGTGVTTTGDSAADSITIAVDHDAITNFASNEHFTQAAIVAVGTVSSGTWEGTTVAVNKGGTGATSLTDGGILLGSGTGAITALGVATNGQIPIGDGTTDPQLATITAVANETDVTNAAGSITIGIVASPTLDATNITGGDIHTQGSDTALGAMGEDIDMNTSYQLTSLATPIGAGEAIRSTADITEAALIEVTDGGETTEHSHAGGSGDVESVGDCADGACLDGTDDGGTYIALYDGDSNKVTISSGNLSGDITMVLPTNDGDSNQFLQTNGSGTLTWAVPSGSGDVTAVGDCADGECLDGSSDGGTYVRLYDGDSNYTQLAVSDSAATVTVTFQAVTGTVYVSGGTDVAVADVHADIMRDSEWTAATLTAAGKSEYATTTETIAGTATDRTVTPDGLTDAMAAASQPLDATLTDLADGTLNEANSIHNDALPETISVGDITATTTIDIPSGATCDSSEAGELCIDTTDDQLIYYGAAARVIPYKFESGFAMAGTTFLANTGTFRLKKLQDGITITDIHCITDTGTVIVELMEQNSTGASGVTVDAPITCDSNGAEDDGTLSNGVIDAGDWIAARIGTDVSTPTKVTLTYYYTVVRE